MTSLATTFDLAGLSDRGLRLHEETLRLMTAKFGADHPETLTCTEYLATAYRRAGKPDLAAPLFGKEVPAYESPARSRPSRHAREHEQPGFGA
jgi:hypothetical protein